MLQSCTFISTVPRLLVEMAIQARVPILWKRIRVWSWIHWIEMTSFAHVIKDLGYGSTQGIEVPSKFRCKHLSFILFNSITMNGVFNPHPVVVWLFKIHDSFRPPSSLEFWKRLIVMLHNLQIFEFDINHGNMQTAS
uniref:Uncharacterized protein n=1 Tax=Fagus sylvatica TaxID=28930 RepID=A0A2N9F5Z3_FAGSY